MHIDANYFTLLRQHDGQLDEPAAYLAQLRRLRTVRAEEQHRSLPWHTRLPRVRRWVLRDAV